MISMKWIGLTGGIACGKSTVAAMLRAKGLPVLDADAVAREVVGPGSSGLSKVLETFGQDLLLADGTLDRKALGRKIFADVMARETLEKILHPLIRARIASLRKQLAETGHLSAIYDVPLLFEKQMQAEFDEVIVVYCKPEQQIKRLMERSQLSEREARQRLAQQLPIAVKKAGAATLFDNSEDLPYLQKQVDEWFSKQKLGLIKRPTN